MKISSNIVAKVLSLFLVCGSANAAFIVDSSTTVNAISISESFEDFYAYSTTVGGSSSTGLEMVDTSVFFIAEFNSSYALFALMDGTSEVGDTTGGNVGLTLTELTQTVNSLIVVDDVSDLDSQTSTAYSFSFGFGSGKNDGLVYSLGDGTSFDLLLEINFINPNLLNEATFLTFDGGTISEVVIGDTFTLQSISEPVSVNSPSAILFLSLGLIFIFSKRKYI